MPSGVQKHIAVSSGLTEADIRPASLMTEFKRLSIQNAIQFLSEPSKLVEVGCPACDAAEKHPVFTRYDFLYVECSRCKSVYVSPRPSSEVLRQYYAESVAGEFRARHFSQSTAQARRQHLLRSLANWIGQRYEDMGNPQLQSYADIRTYSPAIFDEVAGLGLFQDFFTLSPLLEAGGSVQSVKEADLNGVENLGVLTAFEKMEHEFSPFTFLREAHRALGEGGLFFFTTRTIDGFDLQVLWGETPYIFVPEHLNLMSLKGIEMLLERAGFELLELSTPGQLDIQFVQHARQQNPAIKVSRFVENLLDHGSPQALEDFQAFLQKHRLSSHVRVAARKRRNS